MDSCCDTWQYIDPLQFRFNNRNGYLQIGLTSSSVSDLFAELRLREDESAGAVEFARLVKFYG